MEGYILQKTKSHLSKLVKPIIPLMRPEKKEHEVLECIDHTCHNTHGDTASGKYAIIISSFDSGPLEDCIIIVDLVLKVLVR